MQPRHNLVAALSLRLLTADLARRLDRDQPKALPVTPRGTVGRNDPCLCGSGRKFKVCCRARG